MDSLRRVLRRAIRGARRRLAACWDELRARARICRSTEGYRIRVEVAEPVLSWGGQCACCAGRATMAQTPSRAVRVWGRGIPKLAVPLCSACCGHVQTRKIWEHSLAATAAFVGLAGAWLTLSCWEWASYPAVLGVALFGLPVSLLARLARRRGRCERESRWQGVTARWVGKDTRGSILISPSVVLAEVLGESGCAVARTKVTEWDVVRAAIATMVVAWIGCPWLWIRFHPVVHVINVSEGPLGVWVDGRRAGTVPAVLGEARNASVEMRVPEGWRTFEARDGSGNMVDRTEARAGREGEMLYAPAHGRRCFWVEQRSYGVAALRSGTTLRLMREQSFHVIPMAVDGWFEPNPEGGAATKWFSGGVRRTVRQGSCAEMDRGDRGDR